MRERTEAGGGMTEWQLKADGLLFGCERNTRYHTERRAFLDTWHRWMMVGVLLSGSAAIAALSEVFGTASEWALALMLIPTVVGAINLVGGITHKARDHEILARRFFDMAKRINVVEADVDSVEGWRANILDIYGDEPPTYYALNAECHNAVCQARGTPKEHMQRVQWWQHWLRNWLRFSTRDFPKYADFAE